MTPKDYDSLSWPGRFSRGDKQALADVMDYYGTDVLRLVKRILGGCGRAEDAEECVSDVFLAAWNNIERYDPVRASFRTWIFLLAKYKALDLRRKLQSELGGRIEETALDIQSGNNTEQEILQRESAGNCSAISGSCMNRTAACFCAGIICMRVWMNWLRLLV